MANLGRVEGQLIASESFVPFTPATNGTLGAK